jgi:hypothetical protein
MRLTQPGCAVDSPDGEIEGIQIDAWDDESGIVIPAEPEAPALHRGQYVPDRTIPASFWPQFIDPDPLWRRNIQPTQVRVTRRGRTVLGLAVEWNEESHAVRVFFPERLSLDPSELRIPNDAPVEEIGPEFYLPMESNDWPPLARHNPDTD